VDTVPFTARRSTDSSRRKQPSTADQSDGALVEEGDVGATEVVALGDIWKKILRVEDVRREDNFFESGGNSLHAMLLASRVLKATGVALSLAAFFDDPTFDALVKAVRASQQPRDVAAPTVT
jgi:aryl carrier-like protein